jgi:hypothetical protein
VTAAGLGDWELLAGPLHVSGLNTNGRARADGLTAVQGVGSDDRAALFRDSPARPNLGKPR